MYDEYRINSTYYSLVGSHHLCSTRRGRFWSWCLGSLRGWSSGRPPAQLDQSCPRPGMGGKSRLAHLFNCRPVQCIPIGLLGIVYSIVLPLYSCTTWYCLTWSSFHLPLLCCRHERLV